MTKNVFWLDNVCKIKSLWHPSNMAWQRDPMWRKIAIQYSCNCWEGLIHFDPDTFGTTMLLIWQILTDRTKMLYLCPMSISISVPFTPHLPQLKEVDLRLCCCCCECQKNTNRHYSTRPVCVSTLIPFYSIHKCVVACMSPSVCCVVIVVMSAPWSVRAGISKQGDEI